jgi:transcriptional regulator with XRE-family HTH domain
MQTIAEIEAERARARIPKAELCKAAGVNVATYRRCEIGETSPTVRTLIKLADALAMLRADALARLQKGGDQ